MLCDVARNWEENQNKPVRNKTNLQNKPKQNKQNTTHTKPSAQTKIPPQFTSKYL